MIVGMVALAIQAGAATGVPDTAAGKWGIDYGPTQCLITRTFGDGPVRSILAIDAAPISGKGDVSLLLPPSKKSGSAGSATITGMPGGKAIKASWYELKGTPELAGIRLSFADKAGWDVLAASDSLSVSGIGREPIVVPTHGYPKVAAAAKLCGQALMQSWGANPDALVEESDRKDPASWFFVDDYPVAALRGNQSGTVKTVLSIDSAGKPVQCRVVVSANSQSLDAATCKALMARARYRPSPLPTRYDFNRTIWSLP